MLSLNLLIEQSFSGETLEIWRINFFFFGREILQDNKETSTQYNIHSKNLHNIYLAKTLRERNAPSFLRLPLKSSTPSFVI